MANLNFSLILVIIVALTGIITLADKLFWAPKRRKAVKNYQEKTGDVHDKHVLHSLKSAPGIVETSTSIFPVLLIVLLVRSFLFEPFQIPSGSMIPTLKIGDFILVNKFNYGLRLPVTGTKILSIGKPKRGDVMVFKFPKNPKIDYIKRVIGLPGDHIRYKDKTLYVNGHKVPEKFVASMQDNYDPRQKTAPEFKLSREALGSHHFQIRTYPGTPQAQKTEWIVPEGMYFVMGDNRDKSYDSRYWGFVPEKNIVGKAVYIWMNWPHWYQLPSFKYNGIIP